MKVLVRKTTAHRNKNKNLNITYMMSSIYFCYSKIYLFLFSRLPIKMRCPAGIYMFKVNNWNTRTRCEISSQLTVMTPEGSIWRRSGVFIVNVEHITYLVLGFLLSTLSRKMPPGWKHISDPMQSYWGFIYSRRLLFSVSNLTVISWKTSFSFNRFYESTKYDCSNNVYKY